MAQFSSEQGRAEGRVFEEAEVVSFLDSLTDGFATISRDWRVTFLSPKAERLLQRAAAEVVGRDLWQQFPYIAGARVERAFRRALAEGRAETVEEFSARLGVWLEIHVQPAPNGLAVSFREITARKRAERQLIEQAARLREQAALLDHAQDAILVRDLAHRVIFWNKGAEKIYGWTAAEAVGRDVRELIYAPESLANFDAMYAHLLAHGEWRGELRHLTRGRQPVVAQSNWTLVRAEGGRPKSVLAINTDVTAQKTLEEQFLRAQRLESIGTLASGMAHDLNNLLSPILLAARILGRKFTDDESRRLLDMLRHSAERGAGLVRQVLAYARGAEGERVTLRPAHLVRELARILNDTFPKSVRLKLTLPAGLWAVTGDATQIYQVLMNLAVNARDAMPAGGRLEIAAENVRLAEAEARLHLDARQGAYVVLSVTDTGAGIPPEIRDRIFDPFFTTKPQGEGTGLGLSTVAGIVKGHGGFIAVTSEVGAGACFKVFLPASAGGEAEGNDAGSESLPVGAGETVLIVDDEADILTLTEQTLAAHGYRVLAARDGAEAVRLYRRCAAAPLVALVDLMMPGMGGAETIRALRELNPRLRVIATSGLSEGGWAQEARQAGALAFLPKPFAADTLLQAVADLLGQGRPS